MQVKSLDRTRLVTLIVYVLLHACTYESNTATSLDQRPDLHIYEDLIPSNSLDQVLDHLHDSEIQESQPQDTELQQDLEIRDQDTQNQDDEK